jgi:LuxR family maltose regulon positive regulatory protein
MHLVISTRLDPQLPLARMRAGGHLNELRAAELRFTNSEASEFLNNIMGLSLSAEDIAALETRTEGWIAGLQLAAISMQGKENASALIESFSGSHRLILDYLIEEVVDQQPENVQEFLLHTAVLNRLTGPLCDGLTGQEDGQETLEILDHANLFLIPLDEERRWYRYHHLFADLLRQRLKQTIPEKMPCLHRKASEWFEQNGLQDEAIEHSLEYDNFAQAALLIEEQADVIWGRGEHTKLFRWLDKLPNEVLLTKPQLCIVQAAKLFTNGDLAKAELCLQTAENALEQDSQTTNETPSSKKKLSSSTQKKIRGRAAAIRAGLAFFEGNSEEISTYAVQALNFLPEGDLTWRSLATVALGDAYGSAGDLTRAYKIRSEALELSKASGNNYTILLSSVRLAVNLRQQGQLQKVIELCEQQLKLATENGMAKTDAAGCLLTIWGEVLAERNNLEAAMDLVKKGIELTEHSGDGAILGWSNVCLIRVLFSRAESTSADQIIEIVERIKREPNIHSWIKDRVLSWKMRISLAQANLIEASQWMEKRELRINEQIQFLWETDYYVLTRYLIAHGRPNEAILLLQRLLEEAEKGRRTSSLIEILILQALAFEAQGDTDQSISTLQQALDLAEPAGFFRIFIDEGPPMARLLYTALSRGISSDYVRRLIAAFPAEVPEPSQGSAVQHQTSLIEALSQREIEVLTLISEGLTNQDVASRLYLSLNTVKVHTRNIFQKLGVSNRTEAVARAKILGILE